MDTGDDTDGDENLVFYTPGIASTPHPGFLSLQSNPVWSPNDQQPLGFRQQQPRPEHRAESVELEDETSFAAIVQAVHEGQLDSAGAVQSYSSALGKHAALLREQAISQQRHGVRSLRLQELAADLEAESATWRLLFTLHGIPEMNFPGSLGGPPLQAAGNASHVAQKAAALLESNPVLNRVARVVAWQEELAADELDREEAAAARVGGSTMSFSEREGLPLSTRDALEEGSTSASQKLSQQLDPDAATRESGRWAEGDLKEESRITERVWRLIRAGRTAAARELCRQAGQPWRAVTLGGSVGPGPIPLGSAAIQVDNADVSDAEQLLAAEVDLDGGTMRAVWRWTCHQAATQLSTEDPFEAAIFGILGGNLKSVLPLCKTWNDRLWAMARNWLELALDEECFPAQHASQGHSPGLLSACGEALVHRDVAAEGISLLTEAWPTSGLVEQASTSWESIHEELGSENTTPLSFRSRQQLLQWQLILGPEDDNFSRLLLDVLPACVPQEDEDHRKGDGSQLAAKMLRFSGHLGLALVDLGVLPEPHDSDVPADFQKLQSKVDEMLVRYLGALLEGGSYDLIPAYVCRLQAGSRRQICSRFLSQLTLHGDGEARQLAYEDLAFWFDTWVAEGRGDVDAAELSIVAQLVAHVTRWDFSLSSSLRAQMAAWLWMGPRTLLPAIQHTNALLREFALGGGAPAEAALTLLQTLPQEFQDMMTSPVQALENPTWTEALLAAGHVANKNVAEMREGLLQAHAWWRYYRLLRAFNEWSSQISELGGSEESSTLEEGQQLVQEYLDFLSADEEGNPPQLDRISPGLVEGQDLELKLWLGLPDREEDEADSGSYAVMTSENAQSLAESIDRQLRSCLEPDSVDAEIELKVCVTESGEAGSLVEIGAATKTPAALLRAASLLTLAVKGNLEAAAGAVPQVVNMEGCEAAAVEICKGVIYPSAALHLAQLRLVLVQLGEDLETASQLAQLVAGTDKTTEYRGLSPHFSPQDLQQLLECERQTLARHRLLVQFQEGEP